MFYRFVLFLGHGRALESFLVGLKTLFFLMLIPDWPISIKVFSDIQWLVPDFVIAAPFAITAFLQGFGLYLNGKGVELNWIVRAAGSLVALVMWTWILTKSILIGEATTMFPLCIMCIVASTFLLWKAMNRLPIPGARGLV